MTNAETQLQKVIEIGAESLLKGTLPRVLKYGYLNKGASEEMATKLVSLSVKKANEFSHYKIGGKHCQENKNQNF